VSDERIIQITTLSYLKCVEVYQHALTDRGRVLERYAVKSDRDLRTFPPDEHRCVWSVWYDVSTPLPPMPPA
jgi:hypothetical protein